MVRLRFVSVPDRKITINGIVSDFFRPVFAIDIRSEELKKESRLCKLFLTNSVMLPMCRSTYGFADTPSG